MPRPLAALAAAALLAGCGAGAPDAERPVDTAATSGTAAAATSGTAATARTDAPVDRGRPPDGGTLDVPPPGDGGRLDLAALVPHADDLPGATVVGPTAVDAEEAITSDCDDVALVWSTPARAGVRSRGELGSSAFRATAVDVGSADVARSVLLAARSAPSTCATHDSLLGPAAADVLEAPESSAAGWEVASLRWTLDGLGSTAITVWASDRAVVVLEVEGTEGAPGAGELAELRGALVARLADAGPAAPAPEGGPDPTDAGTSPDRASATDAAPAATDRPDLVDGAPAPAPTTDRPTPTATDPAARRVPDADVIGPGWVRRGVEDEPASPEDGIDGCPDTAISTPAGVSAAYERADEADGALGAGLELLVAETDDVAAGAVVDAVRAMLGCDALGDDLGIAEASIVVTDVTADLAIDATDAVGLRLEVRPDDEAVERAGDDGAELALEGFTVTIAIVRDGGLLVGGSMTTGGVEGAPADLGPLRRLLEATLAAP